MLQVTVANNRVQATTTPAPTSPLVDLGRIHLGSLRNITIQDNTGPGWSFAIRMTEFSLLSDTEDVLIQNNTASGVRMVSTVPWYNKQSVGLTRVRVINNRCTAEVSGILGPRLGNHDCCCVENIAQSHTTRELKPLAHH